jgi:hypothetical protein
MRLPIFRTLGQTFGFVVERRFFTLLRLVWFPALISAIFAVLPELYVSWILGWKSGAGTGADRYEIGFKYGFELSPDKVQAFVNSDPVYQALSVSSFVAQSLLSAIIAITIHRLILLDDRQPGTFFNLRLGREEWLYVLAWILYFVFACLAFAPLFAHVAYVGYQQHWMPATWRWDRDIDPAVLKALFEDPRFLVASLLGTFFMLIAITRFGLVFPAIVAEGRISFASSWRLTRGNFWRLIAFWILLTILGVMLMLVMEIILAIAAAIMIASVAAGGQTIGAIGVLVFAVPVVVSFLVLFVVAIALFVAGLSFTYKALGGESAPAGADEIEGAAHAA